jgi:hypothetical protein
MAPPLDARSSSAAPLVGSRAVAPDFTLAAELRRLVDRVRDYVEQDALLS